MSKRNGGLYYIPYLRRYKSWISDRVLNSDSSNYANNWCVLPPNSLRSLDPTCIPSFLDDSINSRNLKIFLTCKIEIMTLIFGL